MSLGSGEGISTNARKVDVRLPGNGNSDSHGAGHPAALGGLPFVAEDRLASIVVT